MKKIYLVALVLALLTGICVYSFSASLKKAATREYGEVVAAAVDIPERTALTAEMLCMKTVPAEALLPTAVTSMDQVLGLFNDNAMEAGEVLSTAKLHTRGETTNGLAYIIPEGKRAFTFSVDAVSGVAGFILAGDRVDIIATLTMTETESQGSLESGESSSGFSQAGAGTVRQLVPTSVVIAQDVEVLAAGADMSGKGVVNAAYTTITVAVTLEDAVRLNLAAAGGKLRMVLRSPLDKEITDVLPVTLESLEEGAK